VAGLLAGNPEPFYFACLGLGGWIAVRLLGLWNAHRHDARARIEVARVAGKVGLACAFAAGFAAFQVLPFLDYLERSRVLEQRSLRQTPLELRWWPLLAFPDALGNPSSAYNIGESVPPPNYELVNMSYVGAAATLLALVCPFLARRRRGALFFPLAAAGWFLYAHDVAGVYDLLAHVPTLDMAPMNRSQGLWNFAVACSAALALDALLKRDEPRAPFAAAWWLAGVAAALVACLIGADRLIAEFAAVPSPYHRWFLRFVPPHLAQMTLWTAAAAAAVALLLVLRARRTRPALGALFGLAVFAQSGWLLRDYNPTSSDRFVFPVTNRIAALQRLVGHERLAILGRDGLPPDSNLVYGIDQVANYDGMWLRDLDHLYRDQFGDADNWRPVVHGSHTALDLFGVRWVLAKWGWIFLDNGLRNFPKNGKLVPQRVELLPGRAATQTFRCYYNDMSRVMVVLSTPPNVRDCHVRLQVEDLMEGRVVVDQTLSSREVQSTVYSGKHVTWPGEWPLNPAGRPVVFRFDPQPRSRDRDYLLTLSCVDGAGGDTIFAWCMPVLGYGLGRSTYAGRPLPGELLFDWTSAEEQRYEPVAEVGDYTLFRVRDALPTYAFVKASVVAKTEEDALELVRAWTFDPRKIVVLGVGDEVTRRSVTEAAQEAHKRRVVQFSDSPYAYLVGADGRTLAHIDDEATFLANRFDWKQIERLNASERAKFVILPDEDLDARRALGLRLIAPPSKEERPPEVLEDTPAHTRLRVSRREPGYLLVCKAYDPGWKATLSGEPVPVLRANYAFQAVEIPPGTWEVELRYWPDPLSRGLWIGAASAALAAGCVLLSRRRRAAAA
jgi:hypothetical protein